MKVSIITHTFGRARWLQENINSVLMQQDIDWEHLILAKDYQPGNETDKVLDQYRGAD